MKPQITKLSLSLVTILSLGVTSIHAENFLFKARLDQHKVYGGRMDSIFFNRKS